MATGAIARSDDVRRTTGWFALYAGACAVLFLDPLYDLIRLSLSSEVYSHVLVIPLISAALVYAERDAIFRETGGAPTRKGLGLILFLLVGLFGAVTAWLGASSSSHASLTLSIVGFLTLLGFGFWWLYGSRAFRAALFPLLFLLLMLPPPASVFDQVTIWLQWGSADVTDWIFYVTATPVIRDGLIFDLPGVSIEVARECSGIRSSIALGITCLAGSYLFLTRSWARAAFLLAVIPVAMLKNGIRIASLSLLSIHVDPDFLFGRLHHRGGIVFFGVGLGVLLCVLLGLQRLEGRQFASGR
jgi:exosortase